ncbi:MAG: Ig-like domain repeat protein [Chloroflexota bacterium]|nr:Ig-like domain repeat protein [Chloroflexota bacterium]
MSKALQGYYAAQGSEVGYRLYYQNYNTDAATNVVLTDTLPSGVTYVGSSGAVAPTQSGNTLTWNLGSVPGGVNNTIYLTVSIPSSLALGTVLTNTAGITATNDATPSNNVASDVHTVIAATRDLYLNKYISAGSPIVGSTMTYTLNYQNYGNASAPNVIITDTLPPALNLVSFTGSFTPTVNGNVLVWNLGTLPGQSAPGYYGYLNVAVQIPATLTVGTTFTNTAVISTSSAETGSQPNTATVVSTVQSNEVDLRITKTLCCNSPSNPAPGSDITYQIDFSNLGGRIATNTLITDTLPLGTSFITSTQWGNPITPIANTGNLIAWNVGTVYPLSYNGAIIARVHISDTVPYGTVVTNTVRIGSTITETNTSNNVSTIVVTTTAVPMPTLTNISPYSAKAGGVAFTLTVTGTNFVNGSTVRWNGSARTTTFVSSTNLTATVPASDITNVGTANVTVFNPPPGGGESSALTFIIGQANTTVALASSKNPSVLGESVTFTATLTQNASASAPRQPRNVTPTGTMTFTIDSAVNITQTMNASGVVSYTTSLLATGVHTITATYSGDANLAGSASPALTQNVNNPLPTLASISPMSATAGGVTFTLTVTGTNFVNGAVVKWNGSDRATTFVSSTNLTATVQAAQIITSGTAYVTVFNPTPGGGVSNPQGFWTTNSGATVTTSNTGSSTSPTGTATASTGGVNGVTASATGSGTVSVAHYNSNPGGTPTFNSAGAYVDVNLASGSSFASLTIVNCNLNGGNVVYWWNGSAWVAASDQSYNSTTHCVTITVTSSTTPSLSDLTGSYFGAGVDTTAPTVAANATAGGSAYTFNTWTKQNVQVTSNAADDVGGSGVKQVTYSATGAQTVASTTVNGSTASFTLSAEGVTTISYYATDFAGNAGTAQTRLVKIDKTAPAITITIPANGSTYTLNQSVKADFTCTDLPSGTNSEVATCTGTTASGANIDTSSVGVKSFSVNATDTVGNSSGQTITYTVAPSIRYWYLPLIMRGNVSGASNPVPSKTPTPKTYTTPFATPTPSLTKTLTRTSTATPIVSKTPVATPSLALAKTSTSTPTASPMITSTPTITLAPTTPKMPTNTNTPSKTPAPLASPTPTITQTPTSAPESIPTNTPTPTPIPRDAARNAIAYFNPRRSY